MNTRYLTIMASLLILTACGQKGPLYLPESETGDSSQVEQQGKQQASSQRQQDK